MNRVTVVGLGREGVAVARVLAREGARVTVSDARGSADLAAQIDALAGLDVRLSLGGNRPDEALDCDLLVLSPGVDKRAPLVQEALRRGITISSETELFFARCPAPIAGITGSAGKTTTTTLVGEMLRRGLAGTGRAIYVGGNIGQSLLERVHEITPRDWVVLELSSFQLEWLPMSPRVAAVTNITPNHLDRHETMAAYSAAKANIVAHQGSDAAAILNADEPNAAALAARTRGRVLYFSLFGAATLHGHDGAFLDGDLLILSCEGVRSVLCRADEMPVPGRHNVANALAAAAVAAVCGVAPEAIGEAIRAFRGVPHRLQLVDIIGDVAFYDDSIATAPERVLAALDALDRVPVLQLGGRDKHLPWADLAREVVRRCRGVVLIGEAAPLIRRHLEAALDEASPGHEGVSTGSAGFQPAPVTGSAGFQPAPNRFPGSAGFLPVPGAETAGDRQDADAPRGPAPGAGVASGGDDALLRRDAVVDAATMADAVARAAALARPGDAVVLAPGCTSYDMYRDFAERGDDFAREVRRLVIHG